MVTPSTLFLPTRLTGGFVRPALGCIALVFWLSCIMLPMEMADAAVLLPGRWKFRNTQSGRFSRWKRQRDARTFMDSMDTENEDSDWLNPDVLNQFVNGMNEDLSPTSPVGSVARNPFARVFRPITWLGRDQMVMMFSYIQDHQPPNNNPNLIGDDVTDLDQPEPRALEVHLAARLSALLVEDVDIMWVPSTLWDLYMLAYPINEVHRETPSRSFEQVAEEMPDEYANFLSWLELQEPELMQKLDPDRAEPVTSQLFARAIERLLVHILEGTEHGRHAYLEDDGLRRKDYLIEELARVRECRQVWRDQAFNLDSIMTDAYAANVPISRRASLDQASPINNQIPVHCASLLLRAIDLESRARERNKVVLFSDSSNVTLHRDEYDQLRTTASSYLVSKAPKLNTIYEETPEQQRVILANPVDWETHNVRSVPFSYSLLAGFLYNSNPNTGWCIFTKVYSRLLPVGDSSVRSSYTFASFLDPAYLRGVGRQIFFLPPVLPHQYVYHYHPVEFPCTKKLSPTGRDIPQPNQIPVNQIVANDLHTMRQYYNHVRHNPETIVADSTLWRFFLPPTLVREIYKMENGVPSQFTLNRAERNLACARFSLALSSALTKDVSWLASRRHVQFS